MTCHKSRSWRQVELEHYAITDRTPLARMLRGNPNVMFCRLAGGSEQAAVCNVSSPNAGPACPPRLSIA
jgi:hypothetical protein